MWAETIKVTAVRLLYYYYLTYIRILINGCGGSLASQSLLRLQDFVACRVTREGPSHVDVKGLAGQTNVEVVLMSSW